LGLTISPNPARFETTITAEGISMYATLLIHDAKGNLISSQTNMAEGSSFRWKLDVSAWAPGNYLVTMQSANGKVTKRLVRVG
ncbi:MAG: T9SS type A sorting domain-containing protein, partial [Flavobacteriales bacterium]